MRTALAIRQAALPTPGDIRASAKAIHQPKRAAWHAGWWCAGAAAALSVIGLAAIGTTTPEVGATEANHFARQVVFLGIGLLAMLCVVWPHYERFRPWAYPALAAALALLIFVLLPWVPEELVRPRNGSRRWINLGFSDIQPSELAKIAYILGLAAYLRHRRSYRTFAGLLIPLVLTFIPLGLVLLEPDLGTSLLFLPTLFAMLVAAGARFNHLAIIVAIGLALAPAMYPLLKPYQKDRVKAVMAQLVGDERHDDDIGYQGARAKTLTAAGGLTGVGSAHAAALVKYNRLPEEHNDMIFAVVSCRWGLLGAMAVWGSYLALVTGAVAIASRIREPFGRLIAVGVAAVLFAQMTINTGMVVGLLPITGMTLPFVSYGGSSMVTAWIMAGLLFNIGMRRPRPLSRPSFEFDAAPNRP